MKKLLVTLMCVAMILALMPAVAFAGVTNSQGAVEEITKYGTVDGDKITVAGSTLEWYPADPSIGRYQEGWWVGARIIAPNSIVEGNVGNVTYSNNGSDTLDKNFGTNKDGMIGDNYYMGCWVPVTPEYLEGAIAAKANLQWTYKFDWTGDGKADQTFKIIVNPNNITLNKNSAVFCKTQNGVMTVKDGKDIHTEHTYGDWTTVKAPTCVDKGLEKRVCSVCEKEETRDVSATGNHKYGDWTTVKAPTCVDKGQEKHVCSVCDKEETRDVAAKGHTYKDGKCSVCSAVDPDAPTHTPIDTTKPVEDVTVGVAKDDVKEVEKVANAEANAIVEAVKAGKTSSDLEKTVDKAVVEAINTAQAAGKTVEVTTNVVAKPVEKSAVSEEAVALVVKGADNSTVVQYLDLSVMVNVVADGTVVETGELKQLSKPITFTIAVPEELKAVKEGMERTYYVIRVHGDEVTKLPVTVNEDGTLSFQTDRFSTYALAYEDTAKTTTTPKTGDATNMLPWLALMAVAGAGAVVFKKKED